MSLFQAFIDGNTWDILFGLAAFIVLFLARRILHAVTDLVCAHLTVRRLEIWGRAFLRHSGKKADVLSLMRKAARLDLLAKKKGQRKPDSWFNILRRRSN